MSKLILPDTTNKGDREGIYNKTEYTIYIGKDYSQGLLTVQERCMAKYLQHRPSADQQVLFTKLKTCLEYANIAPSATERYEFALEAAYLLKEIAHEAEMPFTVNVVEDYIPPVEELTVYNRRKDQVVPEAEFQLLEEYNGELDHPDQD